MLHFYFDALHFSRMVENFGTHSLFDVSVDPMAAHSSRRRGHSVLCIRNVVPAPFLRPRFAATRTTVLFSATKPVRTGPSIPQSRERVLGTAP